MAESTDEISDGERDAISAIADDALTLFRIGLFMIIIYITILSLTLRTGGVEYVKNIIDSVYTVNGVVFWIGSMVWSVLTYRAARRVALKNTYSQLGRIHDKFDVLNFVTAVVIGLLVSVFSLIFGLLEGWANTVNGSAGGLGVEQPIGIITLSTVFVAAIYGIFSLTESIRERYGPFRELLPF